MPRNTLCFFVACIVSSLTLADGPQDNIPDNVRAVPPVGIELKPEDQQELEAGLKSLQDSIANLRRRRDARTPKLLPDIEIFARAIDHGLKYQELFSDRDVNNAKAVLAEGQKRADALLKGEAPWTTQKGLVVRGFRSKIDQTVQPYGLVIPESYEGTGKSRYRLDLWLHGRGERSTESVFIAQRMQQGGRYAPADTIVLHPYGRYSNAFKFAGEIDILEALDHARENYRIDDDRVSIRGFSMGGAGCWQMAVHYPDHFFAANPGAGFSETPEFLKFFQKETLNPTWYEKKLWQMYDCPGYADNLFQLPTVAYSGELDIQKQAADIMETALAKRGMRLTHLIGPETKHTIHPDSMKLIESKMDSLAKQGRADLPLELRFATYTLRYNKLFWLTVNELEEHWEQATVQAKIVPDENTIIVKATNVAALRFEISPGFSPFALDEEVRIKIERDSGPASMVVAPSPETDQSWSCDVHLEDNFWKLGTRPQVGLAKKHGLQGPIDDAFMDSFIVVEPSGAAANELVGHWTKSEMDHLVKEWRRQFRGDAVVKKDSEIAEQDIANSNLILFGDPSSNAVIQSVIGDLPITWSAEQVKVGEQSFDAKHHAPVLIYPNPKNPDRYIVINSGFTYREFAYLNNARQVPKLPDWAIVDLNTPADSLWPGKIVDANFFDEQWQVKAK